MNNIDRIREQINIILYSSKTQVLGAFRALGLLVSLSAFGIIIYYFGFPLTPSEEKFLFNLIEISFGFYILHFWVRVVYDFHPREFFRNNWFEAIIIIILTLEGISQNLFGVLIVQEISGWFGMPGFTNFSTVFVQVYLLLVALVDISRKTAFDPGRIRVHPSYIFISTFLIIILMGTGLLLLPEMTTSSANISFLDALFTSTSATCVTGLIVHDTATFFTFKGQFVIMMLIKLGGLNIIAFGTFMALFHRFGFGVKHHEVIEDFVNRDSLLSSKGMVGKIVVISLVIELLGALFMFVVWSPEVEFESFGDRLFHATFHSISSFNNAGFSTFTSGFYHPILNQSYLLHIISGMLIFLGSLGFTTLLELFEVKRMRERLRYPWKQLSTGSKMSLYTSAGLVIAGALGYYVLEYNNTMAGDQSVERVISSFYNSLNRTAGFNTIDFNQITLPAVMLTLLLMFIGASPSSTGGGIKTTSFFLITASTFATITGRKNIEFNRRTIPNELVNKAYSVLLYSSFMIFLSTFILSISEAEVLEQTDFTIVELLFEEVSAFATTGLSMGFTPYLTEVGKWVVILSMFIGRIGTLTVAYALTRNLSNLRYKYPDAHVMVG